MEEKPPFFRNWRNVYLLVIGFLVIQIVLYYILTIRFQ